jgi:diketogulonate reductase-like aldo/keto reductase
MQTITAGDVAIPVLGFGTWMITGQACAPMVEHALKLGYRHIDTAAAYENEREVGQGLRASGVARDEVFLTTKIWNDAHRFGDLQRAAEASLARLGVDHVDLLLIHWPVPDVPIAETMEALNDARHRGLTRAIGVSNFPSSMIEEASRASKAPLATNQVEYHPFLDQSRLIETLRGYDMALTAYSPLARGRAPRDPIIQEIARRHGRTPGQVVLRWIIQQDAIAIPKTSNPERAKENLAIFDFALDASEMTQICALARPDGRVINPSFAPKWD